MDGAEAREMALSEAPEMALRPSFRLGVHK